MSSSAPAPSSASSEFRTHWKPLSAATIGVGVGVATLPFYTNGLFIPSLEADLGWTRGQLSLIPLIASVVTVLMSPLVGLIVDRWGVRLPGTFSLVMLGIGYLVVARSGPSFAAFAAIWAVTYVLAASSTAVAFTRTVNERFVRARGLALGITLGGAGAVAFAVPRLLGTTIATDWRLAYQILGIVVLVSAVLVAILTPSGKPASAASPRSSGDSLLPILRTPLFIRLALSFFLIAMAVGGLSVHLVPLLRDAGVSAASAASTAALVGLAVIVGRLVVGFLVDRFFAPQVAATVLVIAALGYLALAVGGPTFAAAAALAIGLALGAEVDLIGYFTARYYGLAQYGRLFGIFYAVFTLGVGISPVIVSELRDLAGTYDIALYGAAGLLVTTSVLLATAPRFPEQHAEPASGTEAADTVEEHTV